MRKLALAVVALAALTGGVIGCGGGTTRKPGATAGTGGGAGAGAAGTMGAAGAGAAGTMGAAGEGAAGTMGAAGEGAAGTGVAGTSGAAGTGAAGTGAAAGTTGAAGQPPPTPTYCEAHPAENRALPYNIAQDFKVVHILNNNNAGPSGAWVNVANPDCTATPVYPPFPTPDAGTDAGDDAGDAGTTTEAGTDAGSDGGVSDAGSDAAADETATLQLDDPDAGDAGVADAPIADAAADVAIDAATTDAAATDAAKADGGTDVATTEGGTVDAGAPLPACYEFAYNPALCTGTCWAGVVYQLDDMQPAHPNGICITAGANAVEWYARSSRQGARVKFGFIGEGVGTTEQFFNITTDWVRYAMPIDGTNQAIYNTSSDNMNGVWNAFSVVVEPGDHAGGTYIEVKDIRWIKQ
jgi:hypothetical protein